MVKVANKELKPWFVPIETNTKSNNYKSNKYKKVGVIYKIAPTFLWLKIYRKNLQN